jgi:hypothetical protein
MMPGGHKETIAPPPAPHLISGTLKCAQVFTDHLSVFSPQRHGSHVATAAPTRFVRVPRSIDGTLRITTSVEVSTHRCLAWTSMT